MTSRSERVELMKRELLTERFFGDPLTRQRSVPMQVLNLSLPRTGSMSIQAALTQLGYSCFHSVTAFTPNTSEIDPWTEALKRKYLGLGDPLVKQDFDRLLGPWSAVSADTPAICFAQELLDFYPDAKVLLVERNIDDWYKSFDTAVITEMWGPWNNFIADINPGYVGKLRAVHMTAAKLWFESSNAEEHRAKAKENFRKHYAYMRRIIPKERLLEFRLEDGWEPLCEFLDKPRPSVPFPRVNETAAIQDLIVLYTQRGLMHFLRRLVLFLIPILLAALIWYRYRDNAA